MFDEASSFLDIRQRMTATEVIRSLATPAGADDDATAGARYAPPSVEHVSNTLHDLAPYGNSHPYSTLP